MSTEYNFEQRCGHVYFIQEAETRNVKIGFTSGDPAKRLKALSSGNWRELKLIGIQAGNKQLEKKLHRRFHYLHLRNEWFEWDARLESYIEWLPKLPS